MSRRRLPHPIKSSWPHLSNETGACLRPGVMWHWALTGRWPHLITILHHIKTWHLRLCVIESQTLLTQDHDDDGVKNRAWEIIWGRRQRRPRVNSAANVTDTERVALTITTLFPAIMMMIFQYTAVLKQKPDLPNCLAVNSGQQIPSVFSPFKYVKYL